MVMLQALSNSVMMSRYEYRRRAHGTGSEETSGAVKKDSLTTQDAEQRSAWRPAKPRLVIDPAVQYVDVDKAKPRLVIDPVVQYADADKGSKPITGTIAGRWKMGG
jgi:hypothetical protein